MDDRGAMVVGAADTEGRVRAAASARSVFGAIVVFRWEESDLEASSRCRWDGGCEMS